MAVRTFRVGVGADGNFGALAEADQTAASRADGWTVAKIAATNQSDFDQGTKQTSGTFAISAKPASFLTGTTANAFKTPVALSGTFANTAWTFTFAVRAVTASAQAGRIRMRVFRSVNADGSSATEITGSTQVGTTSAALSTSADATSVVTWSPGATVVLTNAYLFFVLAWEITTASGSNSGDVVIRTGQSAAGSRLVTPDFAVAVNTPLTLAATTTLTPAMTKLPNKQLAAAVTFSMALAMKWSFYRTLAVTMTGTPAMVRQFTDTFMASVTLNTSIAIAKVISLPRAVATALAPAMVAKKIKGISLPASLVSVPTMGLQKFQARTLAATTTLTPTMVWKLSSLRTLAVNLTATVTMTRLAKDFRVFVVTNLYTVGMSAKSLYGRALSVAVPLALTVSGFRIFKALRNFNATTTVTPTMDAQKVLGSGRSLSLDAVMTLVPTMKARLGKTMSTALNFVPGTQRKITRGMALTVTLVPASPRQLRLLRLFASVVDLQVGLQHGTGRKISFNVPVPLVVKMISGRVNRITLGATTALVAALGFVRQISRKTIDILFATAVDPAELLGTGEEIPELAEVESSGFDEIVLLSTGSGGAELGEVGEEAPVLRSVS